LKNNTVRIPVSHGELFDKIVILSIKLNKIVDKTKLVNIKRELDHLLSIERVLDPPIDEQLLRENIETLHEVNLKLWHVEDELRDMEREKYFGPEFVEKARSVYILNDQRFMAKSAINALFNSSIKEEKAYKLY